VFVDARELPGGTESETDLRIVGAGATGMVMAREFVNSVVRVAVFKGGGIYFEPEAQALYQAGIAAGGGCP
jgi:ribulose 1,5-bisphosphate synthetase/thiazole synthase